MPAPKATNDPVNAKVTTGAVGVACATVLVFVSKKLGVDYSAEDAITITGSLGTIFSFAFGYLKS